MTSRRKSAGNRAQKGNRRTMLAENPYGHGFDKVERVIDTIAVMHRRKQITDRQLWAAERYRQAFDLVHGSVTGALDPDKVGGGTPTGAPPAAAALEAAATLNEAERILGRRDAGIVQMVVGQGRRIDEVAASGARKHDRDFTGRLLREALTILAARWYPDRRRRVRSYRKLDAKPQVGEHGEITRSKTAHATSRSVEFSGEDA